jgi:hypothetical protein
MARRSVVEHKSVPEMQLEQKVLLEAHRARGGGDVVQTLSPHAGGALHFTTPTPEAPSPAARRLADQLQEVQSATDWGAVMDGLDDARGTDTIATGEWGELFAAASDLAHAQGWIGEGDWAGAHRLVQQVLMSSRRG